MFTTLTDLETRRAGLSASAELLVIWAPQRWPRKSKFGMLTYIRKRYDGGTLAGSVVPSLRAVGMTMLTEIQWQRDPSKLLGHENPSYKATPVTVNACQLVMIEHHCTDWRKDTHCTVHPAAAATFASSHAGLPNRCLAY